MTKDKAIEDKPMRSVFPVSTEIPCATCKYRDRTEITLGGKKKAVGVTRDSCQMYSSKPNDVLFYKAECTAYEEG